VLLHQEYLAEGKPHFGIIVGTQESFSELLRRVLKLLAALQAEDMPNRLEWLNNYK
jgi:hypothetical protein